MEGALGFAGNREIFVINDNGGQQYRFAPVLDGDERDRGSWISVDMERNGALRRPYRLNHDRTGSAIGVTKQTDALLLASVMFRRPSRPLESIDPSSVALGGLLLRAAASRLSMLEPPNSAATPASARARRWLPLTGGDLPCGPA